MLGLAKYTDRNLNYYRKLKNQMDAHETKAKSIQFRNLVLHRQKINNYNNELQRVKGELSNSVSGLGWRSKEHLLNRQFELKRLGAEAF